MAAFQVEGEPGRETAELEEAAAQGACPAQLIRPKTVTWKRTVGSVWRS